MRHHAVRALGQLQFALPLTTSGAKDDDLSRFMAEQHMCAQRVYMKCPKVDSE